jgi:hypothetical protein
MAAVLGVARMAVTGANGLLVAIALGAGVTVYLALLLRLAPELNPRRAVVVRERP